METWICNEGFHQYLMLGAKDINIDGFEMNMLMHYEGEWLLPVDIQYQDGLAKICYEVSGGVTLQQGYASKELDCKTLQLLFAALWKCYEDLEEYLLVPEGLLLSPERIYYQPGKQRFGFCYYPGHSNSFREEMRSLAEFCMKHTCHQDSEAVLFIYGLYHMLQENQVEQEEVKQYLTRFQEDENLENKKSENNISKETPVVELMQSFDIKNPSLEASGENQERKHSHWGLQFYIYGGLSVVTGLADIIVALRFLLVSHNERELKMCIIISIVLAFLLYSVIRSWRECTVQKEVLLQKTTPNEKKVTVTEEKQEIQTQDMWKEEGLEDRVQEKHSLEETGETVVLESPVQGEDAIWKLEEQQGGKTYIQLNRLPGVLGRKLSEVDYVIPGEGVSRRHLMLFLSGDSLYAEDLASTNGTYVNGLRLQAGMPVKLSDGDLLALGSNQYRVKQRERQRETLLDN